MSNLSTRKKVAAGLATLAVLSPLTLLPGPATASASPTCDAAAFTVIVADGETGARLNGASFRTKNAGEVKGNLLGDQRVQEADFQEAFADATPDFYATDLGRAVVAASVDGLGTTMPAYPADIRGTNEAGRADAMAQFQADEDGTLATFKADVDRRAAAVAALQNDADYGLLAQKDPIFAAEVDAINIKLVNQQRRLNSIKIAGNWNQHVYLYNEIIDPANWSYGINEVPGMAAEDAITKHDFGVTNQAAADALNTSGSVALTTTGSGEAEYSVFGKKSTYKDRYTRGDDTCSQLASELFMTKAPAGYKLATQTFAIQSDPNGLGTITVTLLKTDTTQPNIPVKTNTGI